jgi:hypothetical protein
MFSGTGTVANVLWKAAAKLEALDVSVAKALDLLSIQHGASIYGRGTGMFFCICYCCVADQWSHNKRLTMSQCNCLLYLCRRRYKQCANLPSAVESI